MTTAGKRVNFADVPEQKSFDVLPAGNYVMQVANVTDREASENSNNPGARMLRWEFEVVNNEKYNGRKVWDSQVCVESSFWKIKALFHAIGIDTNDLSFDADDKNFYINDEVLDVNDCVGEVIEIKLGVRPEHKDKNTGREYPAQNRANAFFQHESSDEDLLA